MDRGLAGIRKAQWGAVCALALACVSVPASGASQQDAAVDAAVQKSAPAKTPAQATPTNERKSSSATSGGAAKSTSTTRTASTRTHSTRKKKSVRARGQQKIDSERARSIQEALIREHYMTGEATGTWNQASEDAMRKYQADHGWQSKTVPDSRALIKLGLGPSNDHLLNPESAMISGPFPPRAEATPTASHTGPPTSDTTPKQRDQTRPQ